MANTFFVIGDPEKYKPEGEDLMGNDSLSDVTFLIGPDRETAERYPAHSQILANVSKKFRTQFVGNWKREEEIHIKDFDASAVFSLLCWIYSCELVIESEDKLIDVVRISDFYLVDSLLNLINDNFEKIRAPIYWSMLSFAMMHKQDELSKKAMDVIVTDTSTHLDSDDFMNASSDAITAMLSQNLNCDEVMLIEKCYKWAETHCKDAGIEVDGANMRKLMDPFIVKLAFPAVHDAALSQFPLFKDILSESELASMQSSLTGSKFRETARKKYKCPFWNRGSVVQIHYCKSYFRVHKRCSDCVNKIRTCHCGAERWRRGTETDRSFCLSVTP